MAFRRINQIVAKSWGLGKHHYGSDDCVEGLGIHKNCLGKKKKASIHFGMQHIVKGKGGIGKEKVRDSCQGFPKEQERVWKNT